MTNLDNWKECIPSILVNSENIEEDLLAYVGMLFEPKIPETYPKASVVRDKKMEVEDRFVVKRIFGKTNNKQYRGLKIIFKNTAEITFRVYLRRTYIARSFRGYESYRVVARIDNIFLDAKKWSKEIADELGFILSKNELDYIGKVWEFIQRL
jgi:hypothetical protein